MSPRPSVVDVGGIRPYTIRAMPPEMLFEYFGVRLDGPKAAGDLELAGSRLAVDEFFGLLDRYPFWVPIVTP